MTRRAVGWAWTWIGWTGLALFLGISSSLAYMAVGNPPRWSLTIRMALAEVYVWGVIAPFVMGLARRFPFTRATLWRSLPVHVTASLAISFLKLIVDQAIRRTLFGFRHYVLITSLAPNVLFYWGIVAAAHGFAYYKSSKDRELRASQLEARLAQARLQLLQMQLHPHFLFNTLHTISELVHEDPETADRMITSLSDLLREALLAGSVREVALGRELELLERYLEIQRARFGGRLQVDLDIDPNALDALVPHLVLQPIVENAIRHGIGAHAARGRIRIAAKAAGDTLHLEVEDDGRGLQHPDTEISEGTGLKNTRERLQALYGADGHLTLRSRSGGGVVLTLVVPLRHGSSVRSSQVIE
jgi:two-component system, LytTR family, sensor kinase